MIRKLSQWATLAVLTLCAGIALATPKIETWQTSNGAHVYFVAAPELPIVDVQIAFDAGAARDGNKPGLAAFTNGMLEEGAGALDANTIAERFAAVGARYGASSHRDMAVVSLRSLIDPKMLQPAIETLTLLLTQPTFPADVLERERKRALVALQAKKQSPDDLADDAFYQGVYGTHPYASDPLGTEDSVKALTRDDLIAHYQRYYVGNNATIAIVGALDINAAKALAENIVGKLPAGEPAATLPQPEPATESRTVRLNFPSSQTHILIGQTGIRRGDPDFYPLIVGNHILGGSALVSRLGDEVREKRGLSYSVFSMFAPMRVNGPFQIGLETRNDQAEQALDVVRTTLNRFIAEGPTAAELDAAKRNLTGGFPLKLDSNAKIIGQLLGIGFYHLPLDSLDRYVERVNAVTIDQIRDAFKRRLDPATMLTVLVGPTSNAGK